MAVIRPAPVARGGRRRCLENAERGPGTGRAPTKWEPASASLSTVITIHGAPGLAATPRPAARPLALEEEFGELHFGVESGADSFGDQSWSMGCRSQVRIQNWKKASHGWRRPLLLEEAGGGGMWPEVCGLPLLGPGRPSLFWAGCLETGHGLYEASRMGTRAGGGSLTPSCSLGWGSELKAFSTAPAPAMARGQNQLLS